MAPSTPANNSNGISMKELSRVPSRILVERAVTADLAKDYSNAFLMYQAAIGALLSDINECRRNKIKRQQLKDHVKELLRRAEELKQYQKKRERQQQKKQVPKNAEEAQEEAKTPKGLQVTTTTTKTKRKSTRSRRPSKDTTTNTSQSDSNNSAWNDESFDSKESKVNKREWRFNLDLTFGMRKKTHTPVAKEPEDPGEEGLLSPLRKALYSF